MAEMTELANLVAEMRALGVTRYRKGEVEIDLGPRPPDLERTPTDPAMAEKMAAKLAEIDKERTLRTLLKASSCRGAAMARMTTSKK